jgi:carbamoyl-phosphate synthase small subunit
MNAVISTEVDKIEHLKKAIGQSAFYGRIGVSLKSFNQRAVLFGDENATYKIAALDIGIKEEHLRNLVKRDAYIKVFPYNSKFEDLEAFNPDGYFLSNGPGRSKAFG